MWFFDTGSLIALFSEKDTFHAQALALQTRAQRERVRLVTTDAVVLEVGAGGTIGVRPQYWKYACTTDCLKKRTPRQAVLTFCKT